MEIGLGRLGDDELAELASCGSCQAFDVLCGRYRPGLQGYCAQWLHDRDAADDAVQDALLRAWQGLAGRSQANHFHKWLFVITRNVALDSLSRERARGEALGALDDLEGSALDVDEQVSVRMRMTEIWGDLRGLPPGQRESLTMHEVFGLSFDEIAVLRGSSAKAARQAAIDGRKGLGVAASGRERSCGEVRGVLSAQDRRGRRQVWMVAHLRGCKACRSFDRGLKGQSVAVVIAVVDTERY